MSNIFPIGWCVNLTSQREVRTSSKVLNVMSETKEANTDLRQHTCILGLWSFTRGRWACMHACTWSKPKGRGRAGCSKWRCKGLSRHGHRRVNPGDGRRGGALGSMGNSRGGEWGGGRVDSRSG